METKIQKNEAICKVENGTLMIFKQIIIDKFSFVGDGILDFNIIVKPISFYQNGINQIRMVK
jgi:hypothetical protein